MGKNSTCWTINFHKGWGLDGGGEGAAKLVLGCCACAALHCGLAGQQMSATGDKQQKPCAPGIQFGFSLAV